MREGFGPEIGPELPRTRSGPCSSVKAARGTTLGVVGDPLHLTILYEEGDDGWIVSSIPEVPGVLSQGRTKKEAREMALDALAGMLKLRAAEHEPQGRAVGSESLNIVAA